MSRFVIRISPLVFLVLPLFAQEFRATITGRASDTSGAGVPNVSVKAVNRATP